MRSTAIKALLESLMSASGTLAYPVTIPQGVKSGMTYQRVGGSGDPTFDGSGFQRLRLQVDQYDASAMAADDRRETLRVALDGFRGLLEDGTFLQNAEFLQPIDYYENFVQNYRCGAEFYLYFTFPQ